jgi:glycosyltransferase involved in cell wall biosynthesis
VSRRSGPNNLIRRAIRHPDEVLSLAGGRRLRLAVIAIGAVPARPRGVLLRTLERGTRPAQRGDHAVIGPIRILVLGAAGRRREASVEALRIGAEARPITRRRLAAAALAVTDVALADAILERGRDVEAHPEDPHDPSTMALLGEIDVAAGRYEEAIEHLEGAVAGGARLSPWQRTLLPRARAELRVLDPAWRPSLAPRGAVGIRRAPVKRRVLHLLTNSLPYAQAGYTVRSQQVALAQLANGLDPHMATRASFPANVGASANRGVEDVDGVPYHRLRPDLDPQSPPDVIATETARAAADLIGELRPALLQPTTNHLNAQVALALRERFGLPVVYEVRGFLEETWLARLGPGAAAGDRYRAARVVETAAMREADAVVTLSETMRREILGRGDIEEDAVVVVPNGVDVERFVPGPRDETLAASLGIGSDDPVVGYISGLNAYEGIVYLIRALALLRDRGRRVRLLIVGDGEERSNLVAAARELGLDDGTAIFAGRVPYSDILRYYRTIDIFVVPRTSDRVTQLVTPLKPFEAMAMEKALVVSGVDALTEIVDNGHTGVTFVAEDAVSLANTIEPLLDDANARQALGAAARAWVTEHRTWDVAGKRYLELYRRLGVA